MRSVIIAFLVGILLLSALPQARGIENVAFSVGDEFEFTITDFMESEKVNGTEYYTSQTSEMFTEGDTIKVTVTNIEVFTQESDFFGPEEFVGINYTAEMGDNTYDGFSALDEWTGVLLFGTLLYAFSTFGAPYASFEAPTKTSEPVMEEDGQFSMPLFATSNASFYQEYVDKVTSTTTSETTTATSESISVVKDDISASYDAENEKFSLFMNLRWEGGGEHYTGKQWTGFSELKFELNIDVSRSIVTKLFMSWQLSIEVDDASKDSALKLGFVEGTTDKGALGGLELPGFTWMIALGSLAVMAVTIKRKRS